MPNRRILLKTATSASASLLLNAQDGSKEANTLRAERGFNVPPGKSRRGEPYGQTIGSI